MPNPELAEVLEVGVDYITATSKEAWSNTDLASFGGLLVSEQEDRGDERKPFRFSGYHGQHAGGAAYGRRPGSQIVRLSGEVAATWWSNALTLADNVTRLDVQVTVLPQCGPSKALYRHHRQLLRAGMGKRKRLGFKVWYGPRGPESMTIGQRVSDFWLRIYDKGVESGEAQYEGALRYELEVKRKPALALAVALDDQGRFEEKIAGVVHKFATTRKISLGWVPRVPQSALVRTLQLAAGSRRSAPAIDKRIAYAGFSNRRLVEKCRAMGKLDQLVQAMGLTEYVTTVARLSDNEVLDFYEGGLSS